MSKVVLGLALVAIGGGQMAATVLVMSSMEDGSLDAWKDYVIHGTTESGQCIKSYWFVPPDYPGCIEWDPYPCMCIEPVLCDC